MRGQTWRAAAVLAVAAAAAGAQAQEDGRKLFTSVTPACALCHALKDAGAEGAIGPSLDELKPDQERVVKALKNGIGQMPAFTHLSEAQIQALARYVAQATK
jgi:sulfite dehydrogenase